ncbi:MAG: class B sortase, partial [Bacillota bacterium]|nr:class B sortase [Bacillota bacterium]
LGNYSKQSYWEEHPYVYIYDENGAHRYEIFSAYEASVKSLTYQIGFSGDESKERFLEHCMTSSVIDTGVVPTLDDKILTLSTCTAYGSNSKRWVVQACLRGTW